MNQIEKCRAQGPKQAQLWNSAMKLVDIGCCDWPDFWSRLKFASRCSQVLRSAGFKKGVMKISTCKGDECSGLQMVAAVALMFASTLLQLDCITRFPPKNNALKSTEHRDLMAELAPPSFKTSPDVPTPSITSFRRIFYMSLSSINWQGQHQHKECEEAPCQRACSAAARKPKINFVLPEMCIWTGFRTARKELYTLKTLTHLKVKQIPYIPISTSGTA